MSRTARQSLRVVMIASLVGALSACGGSSDDSAKPSVATTTSTASVSSTTASAVTATEPATDPTAARAALRLADVGAGFANYRKAGGVKEVGAESCSVIAPGGFLTTRDHFYNGSMFKQNDATYFAYSDVYVFRTEALAKKFAAFRATAAFKKCKVQQDDAAERKANANSYVKLTPVPWSDPGHIPTMYRELSGNTSGGKQIDNAFYDRFTLRLGRVVVVINIDSNQGRTTAEGQATANETGRILQSLDAALATRLAGV